MLKLPKQSNSSGFQHDTKANWKKPEEKNRKQEEQRQMQQQIAAFIMRHIHKILYLLAVKSTATRKKRHRIFGSVSFTYTGRKETAQLVCSRRRRKAKKKHSKSHHLKREELSINQSTNMVVVCSI
jgi:hypothetical protein